VLFVKGLLEKENFLEGEQGYLQERTIASHSKSRTIATNNYFASGEDNFFP